MRSSWNTALPTLESNPLLRILLVEDGEIDALAFRRALEGSDLSCEITHCYRAEEALETLDRGAAKFDLAVADHCDRVVHMVDGVVDSDTRG